MTRPRILLIEPSYPNKYPPLGLMKLAAHHGPHGRGDHVRFIKGNRHEAALEPWDRVYVTTLFTFEWNRTAAAIDLALQAARGDASKVFVGGIAASLMTGQFRAEHRWQGVRLIAGLLEEPPIHALGLTPQDFDGRDLTRQPIDDLTPDYSILQHVEYRYPVQDAYFAYATRGCVRNCSFCGVPQLEGALRPKPSIAQIVRQVAERHGERKDLILMDNNVAASPQFQRIIDEIVDLGFTPGAAVHRPGHPPTRRRLDFNQGLDARILSKSPSLMRQLARTCIQPLRIAFDHAGLRRQYETAVRMAAEHGIGSLSNYLLYNFMDTPEDLHLRLALNIALNQQLGLHIWSFPMRYQPVNLKDRSHVGPRWNRHRLRSLQLMLQATHGVVGANTEQFHYIYGPDSDAFTSLLDLPHAFLFHRSHYQDGPGEPVRHEYDDALKRLSTDERQEMHSLLSGPANGRRPNEHRLLDLSRSHDLNPNLRRVLRFHAINHRDNPARSPPDAQQKPMLPPDEAVEDAGLYEPDS